MTERDEPTTAADADLVLRSRSGDRNAFGELWRRHYRSGVVVARSISPAADADDLVQEAYTRIFHSIQRGGGPTGSFRAYLFTSIRNTATDWARTRHETTSEELDSLEDPASSEQATADSLDRSLTHQAFRSLPTRWQEVLWYTEIEGMKPAEIAPLLGLKPTAVAQLAFRAREGLREAWVQAHLGSVAEDSDCAWAIARLGAYTRDNLGRRDRPRVERHVASCPRCMIVAGEAREVSSRLAWVLVPLTIGVGGTAGYLATLQTGAPAIALAAMPSAVVQGAASAGAGAGAVTSGAAAVPGAAGAVASGAAVPGAAGAGLSAAAGATTAGGAAAGSVAVGAAGATAVAGTAGGLLSGTGLSVAAAAFAVAGTVAVGVALPGTTEASVAPYAVESSADPSTAPPESAVSEQVVGPSPADIPALPYDGASQPDAGSPDVLSDDLDSAVGGPGNGKRVPSASGTAPGTTGSATAGTADGKAKDDATADGSVPAPAAGDGNGNGAGNGNGNGAGNGAGNGNGSGPGNGNGGAGGSAGAGESAPPAGSGAANGSARAAVPSLVSSSSRQESGATVVDVIVSGTPGTAVEARIRGTVHASTTFAADGTALLVLRPSAKDLATDAHVDVRSNGGGPGLRLRLSDLL